MKKFVLIGASGYIAPRHLEAIQKTGHKLVAAYDTHDSVGILDRYFPDCQFFKKNEDLKSFLEKTSVDYVTICSPNFMHREHIELALQSGADAICEKPLVLTSADVEALREVERVTQKRVFTILQLRQHPAILALKKKVTASTDDFFDIQLQYVTPRGLWYHQSWKGDISRSGGLSTNIGIHFFDMLTWIFGKVDSSQVLRKDPTTEQGVLEFQRAKVQWLLSIDRGQLPDPDSATFRSLKINNNEFDFSHGFNDLHVLVYQRILDGLGDGLDSAHDGIKMAEEIRSYGELL